MPRGPPPHVPLRFTFSLCFLRVQLAQQHTQLRNSLGAWPLRNVRLAETAAKHEEAESRDRTDEQAADATSPSALLPDPADGHLLAAADEIHSAAGPDDITTAVAPEISSDGEKILLSPETSQPQRTKFKNGVDSCGDIPPFAAFEGGVITLKAIIEPGGKGGCSLRVTSIVLGGVG